MEIYDAFEDGDLERAIDAQRTFASFPLEPVDTGLIGVCKAAMELAGVDSVHLVLPTSVSATMGTRRSTSGRMMSAFRGCEWSESPSLSTSF